jgi:hypothetical protein
MNVTHHSTFLYTRWEVCTLWLGTLLLMKAVLNHAGCQTAIPFTAEQI